MVTITQQEKNLLTLIAKGESTGTKDPYCALWPGTVEPRLTTMTLEQVDAFQTNRIRSGYKSSACGRYQFIRSTLREVVQKSGLDPKTTKFTREVQDVLILQRLRDLRKLEAWKSGSLGGDAATNSANFQLELAKEFASVPVPFNTKGHRRNVQKGESFYAGDGLNSSHGKADTFLAALIDIQAGGDGAVTEVDIAQASANAPEGNTPLAQTELQVGGGQRVKGENPSERPIPSTSLPGQGNVYVYEPIDPLDNRYDFRTGKKVRDFLVNGINPQANRGLTSNSGLAPTGDIGVQSLEDAQKEALEKSRQATDSGITTETQVIDTPAGPQTVIKQFKTVDTPAGPQKVEVKPGTPGGNISNAVQGGRGVALPNKSEMNKYIGANKSLTDLRDFNKQTGGGAYNTKLSSTEREIATALGLNKKPADITAPLANTKTATKSQSLNPNVGTAKPQ